MNLKWLKGQLIVDKADSRSVFFHKNGGNARQMEENLMKLLLIDDTYNFKHWSKEFANAYLDILKNTISKDDGANSKRARYLKQLLIDGPYNKDHSNFVKSSMYSVDNAFADEDLTYDENYVESFLERNRDSIICFLNKLIDLQNTRESELRSIVYSLITELVKDIIVR